MGISAADVSWVAACYPELPYLFLSLPIQSYLVLFSPIKQDPEAMPRGLMIEAPQVRHYHEKIT